MLCMGSVSEMQTKLAISKLISHFRLLANVLWCAKINRDKRSGKYDQYTGYGDDRDPEFRMVL